MIAISILYTVLETVLSLMLSGAVYIANSILDESVTFFTVNQDFFSTILQLIPFGTVAGTVSVSTVGNIIKGIAYGIAGLLIVLSILKSILSPITGGESENPLQAVVRAMITIVLIIALFGINFGSITHIESNAGGQYFSVAGFGGLIKLLGQWFATILSYLGDITQPLDMGDASGLLDMLDPINYLACCVMYAGLITSVTGAAITYIERILSFAVYILIGPIAVSLYACPDTAETFKQWLIGIFTQFMAIFISMIMWVAFLNQMSKVNHASSFGDGGTGAIGDNKIFMLAVAIVLLNLMKDSEKILNSMGLKTMQQGSSARSILAGAGLVMSGAMLGMQAGRAYKMGEGNLGLGSGGGKGGASVPDGISNPFDSAGNLSSKMGIVSDANGFSMQKLHGFAHTMHPIQFAKNAMGQKAGAKSLIDKVNSGGQVTGADINKAFGNSNLQASGNFDAILGGTQGGIRGFQGQTIDNSHSKNTLNNSVLMENNTHWSEPVHSPIQGDSQIGNIPENAGVNLNNPTNSETIPGNSNNMPEDI